jgi:hypothetical protein
MHRVVRPYWHPPGLSQQWKPRANVPRRITAAAGPPVTGSGPCSDETILLLTKPFLRVRKRPETIANQACGIDQNDGVRSCLPYSTCSTANTAVPASPKCGNSFCSRFRARRPRKRIAMSAILTAPQVAIAVLATKGQAHSTKLATFTESRRSYRPADGGLTLEDRPASRSDAIAVGALPWEALKQHGAERHAGPTHDHPGYRFAGFPCEGDPRCREGKPVPTSLSKC